MSPQTNSPSYGPASIAEIDWAALLDREFTPSPASWSEQVMYFLLVDRFSDGLEDGYVDRSGQRVTGSTPPFQPGDEGNATGDDTSAAAWRAAGGTWCGGTINGIRSKIGYLQRLGVTALWISPVLKQRADSTGYHGYGTQDFLTIEPRFGTQEDVVALVAEAHAAGMYVVLDVILNHTGNVFGYVGHDDRPWDGTDRMVAGWRDRHGEITLPFPDPVTDREAAVWPVELQDAGVFTQRGPIANWDAYPEYVEGDFFDLKDVRHGTGGDDDYHPSPALVNLVRAYQYWVAVTDIDGLRIDTVKHMDVGATRYIATAMHEFGRLIGKKHFYLLGEITGRRSFAIRLLERTGLDAALGLDDVQEKLDDLVTGRRAPREYFDLFRNAYLIGQGSDTWFGEKLVCAIDDHDQVRQGWYKSRFAADPLGQRLTVPALALNATTLGMPCLYYGSEQGLDGQGDNDRYLREAMFGGPFGPFRSAGRHVFDETNPTYVALSQVLAVRRTIPALRFGRQYLREISDDGVTFGLPDFIGGKDLPDERIVSVIAWSRVLAEAEVVCAINNDPDAERTAWVLIDEELNERVAAYEYGYSSDPARIGTTTPVTSSGTPHRGPAIQLTVPPAGFVILVPAQSG
ncbi:MAG: alpha-amylase [Austwickia sp.]|nr:alpha-amylase [Austwickia sp.]MBK9102714.1 alpha-amylase [Austwickia sp.]